MPVNTNSKAGENQLFLTIYKNCDDTLLFWRTKVNEEFDKPITNCIGFSIERQRKGKTDDWMPTEILRNRVEFKDSQSLVTETNMNSVSKPSNILPFQKYDWTDHGATNGETVSYRVVAVSTPQAGTLGEIELSPIVNSGWSGAIEITGECENGKYTAYFNRGTVMSQFVSRIMRLKEWKVSDLKEHVQELQEPLRIFLAGELRKKMLAILDEVIGNPLLDFYAALYELNDAELIAKLCLLKSRGHILLSNGSSKQGDENSDARQTLKDALVDVRDRMLGSKGLAHNKFGVVVNNKTNNPLKCWTGSTNWTWSGLCTQLNNGILINDAGTAQIFLDQWNRLVEAGDDFTKELVAANAQSPRTNDSVDVWFTRVRKTSTKNTGLGIDLQALVDIVSSAKESILYVMFEPGPEPLTTILQKSTSIYVKGVVSTITADNKEKFILKGIDINNKEYKTDIIQPEGVAEDFAGWIKEITRGEFLPNKYKTGIGYAITHAKMIVIDPHSDDCKIITGSHNFSKAASEKNDDNFIVVHGSKELAEAYSVACTGIYEHYRWRAYLKDKIDAGQIPWSHLSSDPTWQDSYLNDKLKSQLAIWVK